MNALIALLAWLSLAACVAAPLLRFLGLLEEDAFKTMLLLASLGWFVFATLKQTRPRASRP